MGERKTLIVPYHFGEYWPILPNCNQLWPVLNDRVSIANRLFSISNARPDVVIAGDCMAAIAAQRDDLPLVWFDAHGDFHHLGTTYTGSLGGMPLAMLCGIGDQTYMEICCKDKVKLVWHVGGSTFDAGERGRMMMAGVRVVTSIIGQPMPKRIHLHIDTDVICFEYLPSSIHPPKFGMSLAFFYEQIEVLFPITQVLSIKSYCPRLDQSGIGESILTHLLRRYDALAPRNDV